jgi:iron complex outermembrane recepter protein
MILLCQVTLTGLVKDRETGLPVSYAAVVLDAGTGLATGTDGTFLFRSVANGKHTIEVKMLGYEAWKSEIDISDNNPLNIEIMLVPAVIESAGVVVSATRTGNFINDIPTRVNLITPRLLKATPALVVDDYLANIPGINISRSFGILSTKATITMRGLSGNEQARVLVMIDGVPVNKSDGGSVNWNLLDPDMIERIEVVKGPVSSVYGCDAMGGAINIITRKPRDGFSGSIKAGYGTYNTITGRLNLSNSKRMDNDRSFYWMINGFYRTSDGYITQSKADQAASSYIVPSYLKEYSGELKGGYNPGKNESLEFDMIYYDDNRGTGETIYQPGGNSTDHDTYQARVKYTKATGKFDYNACLYWLNEDYKKVNEYIKDDYTYYDVVSKRLDIGMLSTVTFTPDPFQKFSAGIDIRQGSVDARDKYYTSTDIVYNKGKMFNSGLFMQDEITFPGERFKIITGLRYDVAEYFDGSFIIADPSAETSFMRNLQNGAFDNVLWKAFTPKASANYKFSDGSRVYVSVGRGFRPSVLDDLCRSGRIKGGFKLANPDIKPEYITNFEAGGDALAGSKVRTSLSVYYSIGTDFMYYVNSGDSIDMGFGDRPIYIRTNIPRVDIYGIEAEINYRPLSNLTFNAAYSFNHSKIIKYRKLDSYDVVDLTGKHLTDVAGNSVSLSGRWENRVVNLSMIFRWQDEMWVNDQNIYDDIVKSDRYPAYSTVDVKLSKEIKFAEIDLGIQDIFDKKFYDSKGAVCPGRFVSMEIKVNF